MFLIGTLTPMSPKIESISHFPIKWLTIYTAGKITYGFEIIVQVVLTDHLVFTDKVLTASHFQKIGLLEKRKSRKALGRVTGLTD
jgi:hypothetical protein